MKPIERGRQLDEDKFAERRRANESFEFMESRFAFLADHYGFRKGCFHVLLGTTGSGKSTIMRSLLVEMLEAGKKVLIYSCEEMVEDFETSFSYLSAPVSTKTLRVFHESDMLQRTGGSKNIKKFVDQLEMAIAEFGADILIFDNITTSDYYEQNPNGAETAKRLSMLCTQSKIPFLVVAHTASTVKEGTFFDSSSVRGFRTVTNKAQYVYCYFRLRENLGEHERVASFIYTDKSRNHTEASKACYRISFDPTVRIFSGDHKISYATFKKFFKSAQK